MSSWTNLPRFSVQQLTSVSRMDQLLDDIVVSSSHTHSGADGQGASVLGIGARGTNGFQAAPANTYTIFPFIPASQGNWDRIIPGIGLVNGGTMKTNAGVAACGASIAYPLLFPKSAPTGTWLVAFGIYKDASSGCIAACIGGSPLTFASGSSLSLYTAGASSIDDSAVTSNTSTLTASGIYILRIQVVGKDTLSSGYHAGITSIDI